MAKTYAERFIDALKVLQESPDAIVTDSKVRDYLGWSKKRYDSTKDNLRSEGSIVVRKGPGGPMQLAKAVSSNQKKVFISYSHADSDLHGRLEAHLQPLCRMNLIEIWHDQMIKPGQAWEGTIWTKFEEADLVLLLISADFIASDFCYRQELHRALERRKQGKASVVPIILRSCLWHELPFGQLQALPDKGKAVKSHNDIDEALTNVAQGLLNLIKSETAGT